MRSLAAILVFCTAGALCAACTQDFGKFDLGTSEGQRSPEAGPAPNAPSSESDEGATPDERPDETADESTEQTDAPVGPEFDDETASDTAELTDGAAPSMDPNVTDQNVADADNIPDASLRTDSGPAPDASSTQAPGVTDADPNATEVGADAGIRPEASAPACSSPTCDDARSACDVDCSRDEQECVATCTGNPAQCRRSCEDALELCELDCLRACDECYQGVGCAQCAL
jgi:hypothetical protein